MAQEWHYEINGERQGPITPRQLKQLAISGELRPADLIWKEGMVGWKPAKSIKGLFLAASQSAGIEPPPIPEHSTPTAPSQSESTFSPTEQLGLLKKMMTKFAGLTTPQKFLVGGVGGMGVIFFLCIGTCGLFGFLGDVGEEQSRNEQAGGFSESNQITDFSKVAYDYDFKQDEYKSIPPDTTRKSIFEKLDRGVTAANDFFDPKSKNFGKKPKVTTQKTLFSNSFVFANERLDGKWLEADGYQTSGGRFVEHGKYTIWYDKEKTGKFESGVALCGIRHGISEEYSQNGNVIASTPYVNGKLHGVVKTWFSNGKIKKDIRHYIEGKAHGHKTTWYDNGTKEYEIIYVNGKAEGVYRQWHLNGNPEIVSNFAHGIWHGDYATFEDDGFQLSKGRYEKGTRIGVWRIGFKRLGATEKYHIDVSAGGWTGGTKEKFLAKMVLEVTKKSWQQRDNASPREDFCNLIYESKESFFQTFGVPVSNELEIGSNKFMPTKILKYKCDDGVLRLRMRPTQNTPKNGEVLFEVRPS